MNVLLNRWFLSLMVIPLLLLKFFWVELVERSGESFHGASVLQEGDTGLTQREMATVTGYKLVPARNNADQVHALRVHVVGRNGQSRTLAFTLASTGACSGCSAHQQKKALRQRHASRAEVGRVFASRAAHASIVGASRSRKGKCSSGCNGPAMVTPRPRVPRLEISPPALLSASWSL